MVRAHALIRLGRADEGYAAASRASRVFAEFGDRKRLATARLTEAYALHEAGRREEALVLWFALLRDARSRKDAEMRAYVYNNIGTEFSDRGEYAKATTYLERALRYFVTHNLLEEIPRTRLALAVMRASQGDLSGAIPALWRVHREFMDLRMFNAATGVELRIVEYLLELGRTTEAETLCRRLPAAFGEEGFLASARSAASHLAECARRNVLEVADVRHVRLFLKDLPQDPRRAFTPRVNVRVGQ
jgi:tetratricopeptide (TPR) repeat protein